jgi:EAL domain-containing protein (putative c-di-GMP-specific phosphodiesterase class I)
MSRRTLEPGEALFKEGDPPTSAFLIERGRVRISAERDGEHLILADLGNGDLVGEMAVIDDSPRTASAVALEHCVLLEIDRAHLTERISHSDPIVRALLEGQLKRYRAALAAMQGQGSEPGHPVSAGSGDVAAIVKIRLEANLREALARGELDLRLQPIFDIPAGRIAGYEALVRWDHPERGPVSPAEFIKLAEETSLIVPIGEYMLDAAVAALCALREAGVSPLPYISINVSPRQLREAGLIERLLRRASDAQIPVEAIRVEITEGMMLDYSQVDDVMQRCRAVGIHVLLDDFGTGFSNLSHLHQLDFDTVKIDQSFARNMMSNARAMALVDAIVKLVHAIEAQALVEGIETQEQLEVLRRLGVRYAQGYLIGKPAPIADIIASAAAPAGKS